MLSIGPLGWSYLHAFYMHMRHKFNSFFYPSLCLYLSLCHHRKFSPRCVSLFLAFFCYFMYYMPILHFSLLVLLLSSCSSLFYIILCFIFFFIWKVSRWRFSFLLLCISLILSHYRECHDFICNSYAFICI